MPNGSSDTGDGRGFPTLTAGDVVVVRGAGVPDRAVDYATEKVAAVAAKHGPVRYARVKLDWAGDPANERRARVQGVLDLDGRMVRAQVATRDLRQAVDLLEDRLLHRLEHLADRYRHRVDRLPPPPGEWRHLNAPTPRPPFFDRPVGERELVRHKSVVTEMATVEEAAWDMTMLDFGFFLFREASSGRDALLWRDDDHAFHLSAVAPGAAGVDPGTVDVVVHPTPAPVLSTEEAIERLDTGGEPFVFFETERIRRGAVVYRRYDGHYGLITPPDVPVDAGSARAPS